MLELKGVQNESDFERMCDIESAICRANAHRSWQVHPGGPRFDRYLFGNGANDVFGYGKLLCRGGEAIGYALCYADEGEFVLRLLPGHERELGGALELIGKLFGGHEAYSTIANSMDEALCNALLRGGFEKGGEERHQAALVLDGFAPKAGARRGGRVEALHEADFKARAQHASIPSGSEVSEEMFLEYAVSEAFKSALERVARDEETGAFAGFATWWLDEASQTALLEPVACLPEYRRRGMARRLLEEGLAELKARGMRHVFLSTSVGHDTAIPLYDEMGFVKTGEANLYIKRNPGG